jgi:radical S-adenosyl methionine domain-containing protein 2
MSKVNELVINFHMTEKCNYKCQFCYAKWKEDKVSKELHTQDEMVENLINTLHKYFFSPNKIQDKMGYETVRLNFAGGEPMLLRDRFLNALTLAHNIGFNTSVITNGHFLDKETIENIGSKLSILGLSCDSVDPKVQELIGRTDRKGKQLSSQHFIDIATNYKSINPGGIVKINTVVNSYNWNEDMNEFIEELSPDKWKVLRVLPIHNDSLTVTDSQFRHYLDRHSIHKGRIAVENNSSMIGSYLMIDPKGRFYQNRQKQVGYKYSGSIIDVGVEEALNLTGFSTEAFVERY